jgi:hypothetical protein
MPFTAAGRLRSVAHVPVEHVVPVVPLADHVLSRAGDAARTEPAVAEVAG